MNIIQKSIVAGGAAAVAIWGCYANGATIDPTELSEESALTAAASVKSSTPAPTVAWKATENLDTNIKSGDVVGGMRITQTGRGHICVRTDAQGSLGGKYIMMSEAGEKAPMTVEEVMTGREFTATTVYDTAACTGANDPEMVVVLKKYGDGMKAGEYLLNLYFAAWTN
ncbi:hypothetical protein MX582_004682 [Salmonella enterica]|nr:hypothetical protein [Salmonella enterica]EKQ0934098.1 hypothetical protein [Salmonella enterica]EKQ0938797.1 hypothetical protein [Salmonella enterica]